VESGRSRPAGCAFPAGREVRPGRAAQRSPALAEGLSNADIAGRLVLGEATVMTHVARALMKLGVRDRAQAVVAAFRAGVVPASLHPGRDTARS
jgi:hypothetical protein